MKKISNQKDNKPSVNKNFKGFRNKLMTAKIKNMTIHGDQ